MTDREQFERVERAVQGDRRAMEELLEEVQDMVFNLSLRMLGTQPDAEDALQDILMKVMTRLTTFRGESRFSTWVYRIAVNHLINCKKSQFADHPLSFEYYGADIRNGRCGEPPALGAEVDRSLMAEELKLSCTNVMLQCLDPESRCIYILGTMFRLDSRLAGELLDLSPENYRQKLSRARGKMAAFLQEYCELGGGMCRCRERVDYAMAQGRISPQRLCFTRLGRLPEPLLQACRDDMEEMDALSGVFAAFPHYHTSVEARDFVEKLVRSRRMESIRGYGQN